MLDDLKGGRTYGEMRGQTVKERSHQTC